MEGVSGEIRKRFKNIIWTFRRIGAQIQPRINAQNRIRKKVDEITRVTFQKSIRRTSMDKIKITRTYTDDATYGQGVATTKKGVFYFKTLELPNKNNQRNISCIPEGVYAWVKHKSPKFGTCIWVKNVPNRSEILIHQGNYTSQIRGCILPGEKHIDINGDKIKDVTNSKNTIKQLLEICSDSGLLYIF